MWSFTFSFWRETFFMGLSKKLVTFLGGYLPRFPMDDFFSTQGLQSTFAMEVRRMPMSSYVTL